MNTAKLQSFAADARRQLMSSVRAQVDIALAPGSAVSVDAPGVLRALRNEIDEHGGGEEGKRQVVEQYAYRWFNRIIAFRYMDVHGFTSMPVVSAADLASTQALPEVLAAAKRGEYDEDVFDDGVRALRRIRNTIEGLFNGTVVSDDAQGQAYGLLLQAYCRYWHKNMPFMFEDTTNVKGRVDELLMPAGLLAEGSVLRNTVEAMTPEDCKDVEIIGWLYQFYNAERKDEVMAGFKKGKKAGAAEIPAATQLFTPEWIVRYLVQNTVGRLWLQSHPKSQLANDWEYYIPDPAPSGFQPSAPSDEGAVTQSVTGGEIQITTPEDLTVCDPACGSGHMLTYAFDLLYSIYEEEGYTPSEIPALILEHNLTGLEIDERAANLAAFALTMKARAHSRRFFRKKISPRILQIKPYSFTHSEVETLNEHYVVDLDDSQWNLFAQADITGSLIQPDSEIAQLAAVHSAPSDEGAVSGADWGRDTLFDEALLTKSHHVLTQARYLSAQYTAVVANPPYMGSSNMGSVLKQFVTDNYKDGKADLFAAFIYRCLSMVPENGRLGFMSPYVWMFISSYEPLRKRIIGSETLSSLIQLEYSGFDGATVPICTFVLQKGKTSQLSSFVRLSDFVGAKQQAPRALEIIQAHRAQLANQPYEKSDMAKHFFTIAQTKFNQIPGSPIVYWLSDAMLQTFERGKPLSEIANPRQGLATADNNRFVREWWEVSQTRSAYDCSSHEEAAHNGKRWFPCNKGGAFRRWYGNQEEVINWESDGYELNEFKPRSVIRNPQCYFQPAVSWSLVGSGEPSFRYYLAGAVIDHASGSFYSNKKTLYELVSFLNSCVFTLLAQAVAPTLNANVGLFGSLPWIDMSAEPIERVIDSVTCNSCKDWNSCETSWDFSALDLLDNTNSDSLEQAITQFRSHWHDITLHQRQLEIENNRIVAEVYGVADEVPCDVPLERVSLKRNPQFTYAKFDPAGRDRLDVVGIVKELISYAVGCMFGRYSLDEPGLILASQGETMTDYYVKLHKDASEVLFAPDRDNVIPVTGEDCFEDDIVARFRKFLSVTFGEEHLPQNIAYIEQVLGKDLRSYFVNDFYNDHVKMYSNRPIYWQYSSRTDNRGSFKALIYLHRYTPSTTNTVLAYLRDYAAKIAMMADQLDQSDRTAGKRKAEKLHKAVTECKIYEDETLYPLATRNLEIDLDDGVLVNYLRLGKALRAIPAIEKKRQEVQSWTWPKHPLGE